MVGRVRIAHKGPCSAKTSSAVRLLDAGAIGVTTKLYQNLYHRPPALAGAHQRRIGQIPLFPALTSAHERSAHI